ncbi:MAG TPA: sugar ABC transporter ATP-binding protein [Beutenbergiaceae bacterium]|nr:sugar ABC transporter ATP-binding protein [Beutenbergiaceae bacterium]
MSTEPLLAVEGLAKSYGAVVALRSANLTMQSGQTHALLGANGAGKSTFVKALTGVITRDAGTITMDGQPVSLRSPAAGYRRGIASVFQDPAMVTDLTVRQNLKLTGTDPQLVREELARLEIEGLDLDERVSDVPLPFLRMLDLARALAHRPRLLILDEITAALPSDLSERVFAVMQRQRQDNNSVLFISHRLEEVIEHCDMCTVFRDGGDVASFAPKEGREQRIVASMLGESASGQEEQGRHSRVARAEVQDRAPRLEVDAISAGDVLHEVSFAVRPGEVLGISALEGQGQEALFDVLAGEQRPRSGQIRVEGKPIVAHHPATAIKNGIVLVPADRTMALLPKRSIRENITVPARARITRWGPIARRKEARAVQGAVDRLSIDTRAAAQARRLSGGNQQKLTIGRWLAEGFTTLLLFDPTRGIDIGTKRQIYDLVRELAEGGAAIVMYTSELREIELVCDRALVLYRGKVVTEVDADAGEEALLNAAHGFVPGKDDLVPIGHEAAPVGDKAEPVGDEAAPVGDEAAPTREEAQ